MSKITGKLRESLRSYRPKLWLLSGTERNSGCPLRIAYAGHAAGMNYIRELAFGDGKVDTKSGRIWIWKALDSASHAYSDCDLVVVESDGESSDRNRRGAKYFVPCWFEAVIDMCNFDKQLAQSSNVKNDLRKIRKHRLQYRVSHDPKDLDDFYHRMYLPHIKNAHKSRALPTSYGKMAGEFDQCELLLISREGKDIAGSLLRYIGDQAHAWKLGVSGGDRKLISDGALSAVYFFQLQHLKDRGYQRVYCGGTRAFVNDGGYQHKRKWGMALESVWPDGFLVSPRVKNEGVSTFLRNNPFIHVRDGKCRCAIFSAPDDTSREAAVARFHSSQEIAGIECLDVYNVNDATLMNTTELVSA